MKLIAFDLDETLLKDNKTASEYTLLVLAELRALGHKIVINTARSELFTNELSYLPECDYYIYNGGSVIKEHGGNTVFRADISPEALRALITDVSAVTDNFSVQTDEALYCNRVNIMRKESRVFDFENRKIDFPALKVLAHVESDEDALRIAAAHGLELTTYLSNNWRRYNVKGITKLSGLIELCRITGTDIGDVMFFGDDHGDLAAIDGVGIGVLMKNASDEHKIGCRRVTEFTNNEDGVARFLADYFSLNAEYNI